MLVRWRTGSSHVKYAKVVSSGDSSQVCRYGNVNAIYYEGLLTAPSIGLEESIKILEPNVPMHGFSTLAVAIFKVCLGNDKEASKVFQLLKHITMTFDG
ncbi:hypothetical protein Bca52824_086664 [Brassica carinata]|uniref:Uncharacterized protein n=1 Tax=Brassica carinata TaxID=52824 RepID=A0A8X7TMW8_BRACI|nr:hypothetical protein Bca52824_086664 [Brassica carinata]